LGDVKNNEFYLLLVHKCVQKIFLRCRHEAKTQECTRDVAD
jgi:hypothetical protein